MKPSIVALAGPNGAGKSTAGPALVRDTLGILEYVDADLLARRAGGSACGAWRRIMVEAPRDILAIFREGRLIDDALRQAAWDALRAHREAGQPLAIWRDGRVVWVSPDEFERGLLAASRV